MQKIAITLIVSGLIIFGLTLTILILSITSYSGNKNVTYDDSEPIKVNGEYLPPLFDQPQINRVILVYSSTDRLLNPLTLCPIESYLDLGQEVMVFASNSSLIEKNLDPYHQNRVIYHEYQNLDPLFSKLPIEELYQDVIHELNPRWSCVILHNLVKWAAIYRYGGTYCESDIIPQRVYNLSDNSIVVPQDSTYMGGAYFRFPKSSPIVWLVMSRIADGHNDDMWISFSSLPLTDILREHCGITYDPVQQMWLQPSKNLNSECANLEVLHRDQIYPISWGKEEIFKEQYEELPDKTIATLDNAIGIHLWNELFERQSCISHNSLLSRLAMNQCPKIYSNHRHRLVCSRLFRW